MIVLIAILLFIVIIVCYVYYIYYYRNFCYQNNSCGVITSSNGQFTAGIFVDGFKIKQNGADMCTISNNFVNDAQKLMMQSDGNLVVYSSANKPIWQSGTVGKGIQKYKLVLGTDGNLCLVDGSGTTIWSSQQYCKNHAF